MADGTKLEIVSPERLFLSETVTSVTVPGADGYFTVLGDHAPLMTTLKPGFVTAKTDAGTSHVVFVAGGFADVSPKGLTILADEARDAADFSRTEVETMIADKQATADAAATPEEKAALINELDMWKNLLLDAQVSTSGTAH